MERDLSTVFELAERHQLEVNVGEVKPNSVGINELSYEVLPRKTPLMIISEEITVVTVQDNAMTVKAPYPYGSAYGGYLGFNWIVERTDNKYGPVDRFVLGILTRNFHNPTTLWTPLDSIEVLDVHEELDDHEHAQDIMTELSAEDIDIIAFVKLCEGIPNEYITGQLYVALINSLASPSDIFTSVNSVGCLENFRNHYIRWGDNGRVIEYPVAEGDLFVLANDAGRQRLAIAKKISDIRISEKLVLIKPELGYVRAE